MGTLFDLNDYKRKSEEKCRDCKHVYRLKYPSGKVFIYCEITPDNKTHNKMKKIKLKNMACKLFNKN